MDKSPVSAPPDVGKAPISASVQVSAAEPSKLLPVLPIVNVTDAASLVAVAALPVQEAELPDTLVCNGCTCPSRAYFPLSVPADAVPATKGVAEEAIAWPYKEAVANP